MKNRKRSKCSTPTGVVEFAAVVVDKDPVELAIAIAKERATPEGAVRIADSVFGLNATRELLETQLRLVNQALERLEHGPDFRIVPRDEQ